MRIPDQLVKKRIEFNCSKLSLQFDVAQSLFSSYDIDAGTRALLNSLRKNSNLRYERVLDLGCGYGPIGIFVKALYPAASVTLADRDALAVAFSSHNAALNEVEVSVCASDGCRDIEGPFDLILTNYPAKLGYCGLDKFLAGAAKLLTPGGCLAIVAVRELEGELDELVAARQFAVRMRQSKPGYVLLHLERDTEGTAADVPQDPSSEVQLHLSKSCCIQTNRFLPEFDQLSYSTALAIELLREHGTNQKRIAVIEPGQGHIALAAVDLCNAKDIQLIGRDLLSLRSATSVLSDNTASRVTSTHTGFLSSECLGDYILWGLDANNEESLLCINAAHIRQMAIPVLAHGSVKKVVRLGQELDLVPKVKLKQGAAMAASYY